ncbi:hypothetical protein IscW_ISCW005768 [Ixodes scapularis]|uniref:Uncharacterized protein n=1 Tax=Ixodes scapularis TaxID=6945 RepID=B7PNL0_IXOSC|nr:hypothetical protein IscW_ISCW005768 [Ixodes scapularis]|eukprot:XP_002435358.1 hypothetical protein IscW_ISCW005768 [Ixodes scapularis]
MREDCQVDPNRFSRECLRHYRKLSSNKTSFLSLPRLPLNLNVDCHSLEKKKEARLIDKK